MIECSLEKVMPYLFYAKHLFDFHILRQQHISDWTEKNMEESLNLVFCKYWYLLAKIFI